MVYGVRDEIYNAKNDPTLNEKYPQNGIEYIFFGGGEPHIIMGRISGPEC